MRVPLGFRLAGVRCGIKRSAHALDLTLIVCDQGASAAGVYTQNLFCAAPVKWNRRRTPGDGLRAVVVNSGIANACTGQRGAEDAAEMARLAAECCGAAPEQVLVMSTGLIGEFLPMEKIAAGISAAAGQLDHDEDSLTAAARGMMTTDTVPKVASRTLEFEGTTMQIVGLAKGAAMIGPNMATMLGLVITDAALSPEIAQASLAAAVRRSFNCISVEGHTSTNDTVLLLASGAAGGEPLSGESLKAFDAALAEVCEELARAIVADGEGATHSIEIEVAGCVDEAAAHLIAQTVANSALVKTAITGADPNWGRVVSAAGYAGVPFDPAGVSLSINGFLLFEGGAPVGFDAAAVSASIRGSRETAVALRFSEGQARVRFWTTDLTAEYVRLNADYHT